MFLLVKCVGRNTALDTRIRPILGISRNCDGLGLVVERGPHGVLDHGRVGLQVDQVDFGVGGGNDEPLTGRIHGVNAVAQHEGGDRRRGVADVPVGDGIVP